MFFMQEVAIKKSKVFIKKEKFLLFMINLILLCKLFSELILAKLCISVLK